ncbi:putative calcium-dependent channel, 7TM region phosphate [Rosa chinensis]|uniref:Putative calcium-dependent channel, 7TM region phosphate n=1 Tax=Rosa chinensis TaxID=74649 RepID=A0A2P6Q5V0_ROSCH|nr:CSC1-like protein ERD4 [Rosa chinensis]PRQ29543.1 putative calcium-dependent channel, 7TM region phosphate [Rosa chinensis]
MDLSSFLTSLGTSFAIFVILMFLFAWLSGKPGNAVVYYPNRILKGLDPWEGGSKTRNPFAWIKEALTSTEQEVIAISGVDTAVYFVFLSTVLGILVLSSLILLPMLLPVSVTDTGDTTTNTTTSHGTFSDLDKLSIGNVQAKSPRLWAFLLGVYWVSFVTYILLWKAYKHVSDLRANALMSPDVKPEQFAVLVRDIPAVSEGPNRKDQVDSYFRAIYPETYYKSLIATDNKVVNKLWKELEGFRKKLERAEAVYATSKTTGSPGGTRPTNKTGFLGLCGAKVDSIEYYTEKINETIPKLEAEQKATLREKQLNAAIVFFTSRAAAAAAAQSLHSQMVDKWTVTDAPEPRQVLWPNLKIKFFQRQVRQYVVYIIVALTVVFYMIPITFISAFTTLDNLVKLIPFIKPVVRQSALKTVLEAFLPQLALIIFLALLPKLLFALSKAEGIPSQSHAVRSASGKYFYFTVFNVFLGVTIGGTLFSTFKEIQKNPSLEKIITLLANSLPGNATYFVTFVALKFFIGYGLELSRLVPLIIFHLKRKYLCKTEGELKAAWQPSDLGYGTRVPGDLLIITIVLCYSVIAPLIIPFGVLYFGIGWLVLRNQALKVYCPAYESYGRFWPHMQVRILAALLLYQVTMFGFFGVKKFVYAPFVIPLPILSLIFCYVCSKKFYRFFKDAALEVASHELKDIPNMEQIYKSYLPPSLSSEKVLDDDQFEDAKSNVSRTTSFA